MVRNSLRGTAPRRTAVIILGLGLLASGCANDTTRGSEAPSATTTTRVDAGRVPPASGDPAATATFAEFAGAGARAALIGRIGSMPTALAASPDGSMMIVTERSGLVYRIDVVREDGGAVHRLDPTPILDLRSSITTDGEGGLLGVALTVDGKGLVLVSTALDGRLEVRLYRLDDLAADGRLLTSIARPIGGHYGGDIEPDGDGGFFLSVGDGDTGRTAHPLAQDPSSPEGAILRLPASILDATTPFDPVEGIVAKGLRNPWRIDYDGRSGDLWIADVGFDTSEEIDRLHGDVADTTVPNYGWPALEGTTPGRDDLDVGVTVPPVLVRSHDDGVCAVVGGDLYRGAAIASLRGAFVYGDFCSPEIRAFRIEDGEVHDRVLLTLPEPPVSIDDGVDGEIFVLAVDGALYRLDPRTWAAGDSDVVAVAPTTVAAAPPATADEVAAFCDGQTAWIRLVSLAGDAGPDEVRQVVESSLSTFRASAPRLPVRLRSDGATIVEFLQTVRDVLSINGWDLGAEAMSELSAANPTGRWAPVGEAIARFAGSGVSCG